VIYIFEVVLIREKVKLPKITIDIEGMNSNDANNKILDMYKDDLRVYSATLVGSRKSA
jgi:hypothetical protein